MSQEYTTLKVPKTYLGSLNMVKSAAAQKGLSNFSVEFKNSLADKQCPFCNREMTPTLKVGMDYTCPTCGFTKPVIQVGMPATRGNQILAAVGTAALVGLGIYLISKLLES
jgi:predicted RNA-binding Zn-ribbon protein involved in translation (DUF1610 family)